MEKFRTLALGLPDALLTQWAHSRCVPKLNGQIDHQGGGEEGLKKVRANEDGEVWRGMINACVKVQFFMALVVPDVLRYRRKMADEHPWVHTEEGEELGYGKSYMACKIKLGDDVRVQEDEGDDDEGEEVGAAGGAAAGGCRGGNDVRVQEWDDKLRVEYGRVMGLVQFSVERNDEDDAAADSGVYFMDGKQIAFCEFWRELVEGDDEFVHYIIPAYVKVLRCKYMYRKPYMNATNICDIVDKAVIIADSRYEDSKGVAIQDYAHGVGGAGRKRKRRVTLAVPEFISCPRGILASVLLR
jgi:hypothetical protein